MRREQREQLLGALFHHDGAEQGVLGCFGQEEVERCGQRLGRVRQMRVDALFDGIEEAFGLAQHEDLGELLARAELLVQSLPADAGGDRDVGHRHVDPVTRLELLAGGVEQRVTQQLAGCHRVGDAWTRG